MTDPQANVSRETEIREEAEHVYRAMNTACASHSIEAVEQASANMLTSAIISGARIRKVSDEDFRKYCRAMVEMVFKVSVDNWGKVDAS